jgi:NAD+ synthase
MQADRMIDFIVDWLRDYCRDAGMRGFVVGISGGIDSSVTSTLCARTGFEVVVLDMPILQAAEQRSLASQHAAWLENSFDHVSKVSLDLTPCFQAFASTLPPDIQDELTMANTRSRLRMVTLYAFAGHHSLLVAGTGNKVEDFGVGFFTKYGDGGVDIAPIADLMKSEVYLLGQALGLSQGILDAAPTDGLWADNRSDEAQIGASYPELEWAMDFDRRGGDESGLNQRQLEVLSIYRTFHRANRHKMVPIPVAEIPDHLR